MVVKKLGALATITAATMVAMPFAQAGEADVPVAPKATGAAVKAPSDMGKYNTQTNGTLEKPATIWAENFDELHLPDWFSHTGPKGWKVKTSKASSGEKRWRGWTFTDVRQWTWAAGTDERHWFTRGSGNFAVMESEHQRLAKDESFSTALVTPQIPVGGQNQLVLGFDSHYRQGKNGQNATVTISFGGGEGQTLLTLDKNDYSNHHELEVKVPGGAKTAQISFNYNNSYNDKWWAIDNVALHKPYKYEDKKPTGIIDIISDTHANPDAPTNGKKWGRAMDRISAFKDKSTALVVNGDFVDTMRDKNYFEAEKILKAHPYTGADILWGSGNHEQYGQELSSEKAQKNFLTWADRDKPYAEKVVGGVVLIALGTEYYDDHASQGKEPFWNASQAQLYWLKGRLDHWENEGRPVLIFSHYTLANTVSGTHSAWYQNDYNDVEELNDILSGRKNVAFFTSHTHDIVTLNDWWGRYTLPENVGDGIPVFNTGAVKEGIVPDGDNDEETLKDDRSSSLRARVFDDHLTVEAWDLVSGKKVQEVTLPIGAGATAGGTDDGSNGGKDGEGASGSKDGSTGTDEGDNTSDPGAQPGTEPGTQPGAKPGSQPGAKPSSQPGAQPSGEGKNAGGKNGGKSDAERQASEPKTVGSFIATTGATALVPTLLGAMAMISLGAVAKLSRKKN